MKKHLNTPTTLDKQQTSGDFFSYKRKIIELTDTYIENKGFSEKSELQAFLYNQHQHNPDGIIMEINTSNVGGPGMIEIVDAADVTYLAHEAKSEYALFIKHLHQNSVHENKLGYFEKYILAELKDKQAEQMILLFNAREQIKRTINDIGLSETYASYIPFDTFHKLIKSKQIDIEKTLLMAYGFDYDYRPHQNDKKFQELFKDRYINQEDTIFSSKLRPVYFQWQQLTGPYFGKDEVERLFHQTPKEDHPATKRELEKNYILKKTFSGQGKGIFFPGERNVEDDYVVSINSNVKKIRIPYFALQKFHELPRKFSVEAGSISAKTVDIRAYVTISPQENVDIQLFGREGDIGKVNNVSSGGKFTKIYTVADEKYYPLVEEEQNVIMHTGIAQHNALESFFDSYAKNNFTILPQAKIAPFPFILSETGTRRIYTIVSELIEKMINNGSMYKNEKDQLQGTLVLGIDLSINPLPKDEIL